MATYVLTITFVDNDRRLEVRPRHRAYLRRLLAEGRLAMAGPWGDDTGAMIVYDVADEAEARAILAADPYTEANVIADVCIREWNVILPEGVHP